MKINVKKFTGLYTHPNPLSEVPEGALSDADDCIIDREGIIENRRGFNFYGSTVFDAAIKVLIKYKNRSIVQSDTTLSYDSDGTGSYTDYTGDFDNITGTRIKFQELNGSLFFTTGNGAYKLDALTNQPAPAGVPQPLDMVASFASTATGFLPYDSQVAYRMTWSRTDANEIETQSAPSQRTEVVNYLLDVASITKSSSTATATTTNPHGFTTNDIVDIQNSESFLALTSLTQLSGVVTGTATAHGLSVADVITVRGAFPDDYNGTFVVDTVPTANTFTYLIISNPVSPAYGDAEVGRNTDAYNGSYVITVTGATTFTYKLIAIPLTSAQAQEDKTIEAGKNENVSLTFPVPQDVVIGDSYKIFRSETSVSADVTASDRMQLVQQGTITATTDVTVVDSTSDDFKGEDLYTNATQQGIAQANDVPPMAKDIAVYKNFMFYANTQSKQNIQLQLLSVDGLVRGTDYFYVEGQQYHFDSVEDSSGSTPFSFRLFADINGCSLTRSSGVATINTVVNHGLSVGDVVFLDNATDNRYNDRFIVITKTSTTFTVNVDSSAASTDTVTVSTGSPGQNIANTVLSLVKVINRTHPDVYAYYTSGPNDIPGSFRLVAQSFDLPVFDVAASVTATTKFAPTVSNTVETTLSTDEIVHNRLFYSKDRQPDSVPALNYYDVGPRDEAILRIIGLRDSLFIIKENSIWRLAGEDPTNFVVTLFDNNVACRGADTVASLNNTIYMFSSQGIVSVGDSGVEVVSRPIETDLLPIADYTNAQTIMHGIGYESERKYILFFQDATTDTDATAAYVYNIFTKAWTKWLKPANSAVVLNDTLYLANNITDTVLKERKNRNRTDKKDESAPAVIAVDSTGLILTVSSYTYSSLAEGQLIEQSGKLAKVLSVSGSTVTVDRIAGFTNAACTISNPINMFWKLLPQVANTPDEMKQFREVQAYPLEDSFSRCELVFSSDLSVIEKTTEFEFLSREQGFGFAPFGETPWGDSGTLTGATPLRTYVPKGLQRCRGLLVGFTHSVAQENVGLLNVGYVYEDNSERTTK